MSLKRARFEQAPLRGPSLGRVIGQAHTGAGALLAQ
jgi:hypothetical protein